MSDLGEVADAIKYLADALRTCALLISIAMILVELLKK